MDAQEMHDLEMSRRREKKLEVASRDKLRALLAKKNGSSLEPLQPTGLDPIGQAVAEHPGLTREAAAEMAEKFGF